MTEEWFYSQNGQQAGPVEFDSLRQMAASGKLRPADLVWKSGMSDWSTVRAVPGIIATAAPAVPLNYANPAFASQQFASGRGTLDAALMMRYDANKKSLLVAYLLWWFLGIFGAHRFYLGRTGSGVAMLVITLVSIPLVAAFLGMFTIFISIIWAFVDAFLIPGICREFNNGLANRLSGVGYGNNFPEALR